MASAVACHVGLEVGVALHLGELRRPVEGHPAHQLRRHVVPGLAPRLPDALVGPLPHVRRARGLGLHDRPEPAGEPLAAPGVEEDGVQHGAEHVVLALVERTVADAHRASPGVAAEMVEGGLLQVAASVDAVHDLHRTVGVAFEVGHELHELVGLPVEVQPVQGLDRERGVAHPAVPVVPVALATGRLGQAGRQRGDGRTGRHVGEPLDGQAPSAGSPPGSDGRAPAPRRASAARTTTVVAIRWLASSVLVGAANPSAQVRVQWTFSPRSSTWRPRTRPPSIPTCKSVWSCNVTSAPVASATWPLSSTRLPRGGHPSVVEDRLAHQLDLDATVDALGCAHEQVLGVDVRRWSGVGRDGVGTQRRAHRQGVTHHHPARWRLPRPSPTRSCRAHRPATSGR